MGRKIPNKKLCLAVNIKPLEGDSVSTGTDGSTGVSVLWRDWTFAGSEAALRWAALSFWNSRSLYHSVTELTPHENK